MTTKTRQATCPRDQTPLVWIDDQIGYRCPRCALFVCIPKQSDNHLTSEEMTMTTAPITQVPSFSSIEPDVTDVPITQSEDGDWFGWGHLDPATFLAAIDVVDRHWGNDGLTEEDRQETDHVSHLWAIPDHRNPEETWVWCSEGTPYAVPITTVAL